MKIAVDISPIDTSSESSHKVRGVGKYITLLKDNLEKFDKKNSYIFSSYPQSEKVDLIHYPFFDPFFINLPLKNKTKTVVTVHDVIPITHRKQFPVGIKGRIKWNINKSRLQRANAIITDSEASKIELMKVTDISSGKIHSVHLAVEEDFKQLNLSEKEILNIRNKYGLPEKFLLYVGDVTWNKNLPSLIQAVKELNIPLAMVGKALVETDYDRSNPWNKDRILIEKETSNNALFIKLGFVSIDDLVRIYNLAVMLCMPSYDEGFGLPVLEAMSSGCPVLSSSLGSLPEVGGDAVRYIDPYDVDNIKEVMKMLYENENIQEDCRIKGLKQASEFTLEKTITETIVVYEKFNV